MCASKFPSPPANVYTTSSRSSCSSSSRNAPNACRTTSYCTMCSSVHLQQGVSFTDRKGACAYASQAVLALWWQVHCRQWIAGRAVCAPLCTDLTWGSSFLPETFRAPQCLLFVKKMHLPKQTILAPFRPMFESQLCARLRHRRSDLYCSTSTIFIILILDLTSFVLFSSCIPIL